MMDENEANLFWSLIVSVVLIFALTVILIDVGKERDLLKSQIEVYKVVCDER